MGDPYSACGYRSPDTVFNFLSGDRGGGARKRPTPIAAIKGNFAYTYQAPGDLRESPFYEQNAVAYACIRPFLRFLLNIDQADVRLLGRKTPVNRNALYAQTSPAIYAVRIPRAVVRHIIHP